MASDVDRLPDWACYLEAGYSNGASRKTLYEAASRLAADSKIVARVAELRANGARRAEMTIQGHLETLENIRDQAIRKEQYQPATRAEELRGRVAGLYVEKLLVEDGGGYQMTEDELCDEIARQDHLFDKIVKARHRYLEKQRKSAESFDKSNVILDNEP